MRLFSVEAWGKRKQPINKVLNLSCGEQVPIALQLHRPPPHSSFRVLARDHEENGATIFWLGDSSESPSHPWS